MLYVLPPPDGATPLSVVPCRDGVQRGGAVAGGHLLPHWVLRLPPPRQGQPWYLQEHCVMEELTEWSNNGHEGQQQHFQESDSMEELTKRRNDNHKRKEQSRNLQEPGVMEPRGIETITHPFFTN